VIWDGHSLVSGEKCVVIVRKLDVAKLPNDFNIDAERILKTAC
jgi:hypothetical protein